MTSKSELNEDEIKIEPDPVVPGRFHITMPDPTPTQEELDAIAREIRGSWGKRGDA